MRSRVHLNIPVSNLEASVEFYQKLFDAEPSKRKPDYANFRLDEPALHLALVLRPDYTGQDPALDFDQHFGIELFDHETLLGWKNRLKALNILPHLEEEAVTCCYAVADKFWVRDPDQHEWEFWVRTDDEGETLIRSRSSEAGACCAPPPESQPKSSCCESSPATSSGCCS